MTYTISIKSTPDLWLISVESEVLQFPKTMDTPLYCWPSIESKTLAFGLSQAINRARLASVTDVVIDRPDGDAVLRCNANRLELSTADIVFYRSPDCTHYPPFDVWRLIPGCLLHLALNKRHKLYRVEFPKLAEKPLDNTGE